MADPFHYDGKRVVVTGGASGVGAALVGLLFELGAASVTVLDVKLPADGRAGYVETDLSREESVEAAVAEIDGPVRASVARAHGVRVNSVCPAPIDTPLLADFRLTMSDQVIDWTIAQAGGRLMSAREVAMPLAFLGSDAASYINGVNLVIDGGFAAAMTTGQLDFAGLA